MSAWSYTTPPRRTICGRGLISTVGSLLSDANLRNVLLVTTPGRRESPTGVALERSLGRHLAGVAEVDSALTPELAQRVARDFEEAAGGDLATFGVVSLGGGSTIDAAKTVCFVAEQRQRTPGAGFLDVPAVRHIAIPTTLVGAEASSAFAIVDERTGLRRSTARPTLTPALAVHDADVLDTLRDADRVASALVALAHAVDAALSPDHPAPGRALAMAAIADLMVGLVPPTDEFEAMLVDAELSLVSGAALSAAATAAGPAGLTEGIAQLVAGRNGLSHARAVAALAGPVARFNTELPTAATPAIAAALGGDDVATQIALLAEAHGLSRGLGDFLTEEDIEAAERLAQSSEILRANPRGVGPAAVRSLIEDGW